MRSLWVRTSLHSLTSRRSVLPEMTDNVLASIPGEHIARAAMSLPEARDAPDVLHYVELQLDGRHLLLTFKRFKQKRGKTTRWFWTGAWLRFFRGHHFARSVDREQSVDGLGTSPAPNS